MYWGILHWTFSGFSLLEMFLALLLVSDLNVDDSIVSGLKFLLINKGDVGALSQDSSLAGLWQ